MIQGFYQRELRFEMCMGRDANFSGLSACVVCISSFFNKIDSLGISPRGK